MRRAEMLGVCLRGIFWGRMSEENCAGKNVGGVAAMFADPHAKFHVSMCGGYIGL